MKNTKLPLPIDKYLDEIIQKAGRSSTLLIKASPGSGKTTRLPWALARHSGKKVIVLEPRRLAAKLAAERVAFEENLTIGSEIGYHFRFDKKVSDSSKLIFYTEGTFLKLLKDKNFLNDVSYVILDEFHERHIETDLALSYLKLIQKNLPTLKIVLMSATLDPRLVSFFENVELVEIEAPIFPIDISYLKNVPSELEQPLETKIKSALNNINSDLDVLIFLPGMREMLKIRDYLGDRFGKVCILHSETPKDEQEMALKVFNERKIVLATNIAESSITIPGIRAVIDSGIQREAFYSPWHGLKVLQDVRITKSSVIQRAGRAGRTGPSQCIRLYSEFDFNQREEYSTPEIVKADLTNIFLLMSDLKLPFEWFTPPPQEREKKAKDLLMQMGAFDQNENLTAIGHETLKFPIDARLGRVLVAGENLNKQLKTQLLKFICEDLEKDSRNILKQKLNFYLGKFGNENFPWEKALLTGFVDQVAKYRPKQHDFIHYSGKTLKAHYSFKDLSEGLYLVFDISQRNEVMKVVPIEEEWLFDIEPFPISEESQVIVEKNISLQIKTKIGSILLEENTQLLNWKTCSINLKDSLLAAAQNKLSELFERYIESEKVTRYKIAARFLKKEFKETNVSFKEYIELYDCLNWDHTEEYFNFIIRKFLEIDDLDLLLPATMKLSNGKNFIINYELGEDPYLSAYIQDFYGIVNVPKICQGQLSLSLRLLGPHKRPLQVTKEISGFWIRTYLEMKKELQREYPRHYWPDDPSNAKPFLLKSHLTR